MIRSRLMASTVGVLGVSLLAAACAPGTDTPNTPAPTVSSVKTDAAGLGDVTLTVWDQEVRGGQAAQMKQLNDQFQKKYPNIKIKRVSRSFEDLKTTLRLALSGNEPPDVVEANNGRSDMGEFVKANELLPLDAWAKAYGWKDRYPASVRQYVSYSADGKTFGEGNLYGLPQVGEVVGIYYDKKVLARAGVQQPKSWAEFQTSLQTLKDKGIVPLMLGNLQKWPAIHVFGTIQGRTTSAEQIRQLAFGSQGPTWVTPENQKAAQTLVTWVDKGYFNSGFNGKDYDPAWQDFGKGTGAYLIAGTWLQADLEKTMGGDVGFMLPPGETADTKPLATGGTGLPFSITTKSKHPDAAAAYLNFITDKNAATVLAQTDNLPLAYTADQQTGAGLQENVFTGFASVVNANGLLPYLDYATPTMYDTLGAALQDLLAKKSTPQEFLATVEKDRSAFVAKNG